ncbi:MAG: hypothetical protein Q8Q12_00510 [bacterium]|nr:hypothetical protein [bacterium]
MKKTLLLILLAAATFLAGCNGGPEPKPDTHYEEDITGPGSNEEGWW